MRQFVVFANTVDSAGEAELLHLPCQDLVCLLRPGLLHPHHQSARATFTTQDEHETSIITTNTTRPHAQSLRNPSNTPIQLMRTLRARASQLPDAQ
jgi:hypothetical protein